MCIRDRFREAFDGFDVYKISAYDENKQAQLKENEKIIRNQRKILAAVTNAQIFLKIQEEYGSFSNYLWQFTENEVIYETGKTSSELSDKISKDLKKMCIRDRYYPLQKKIFIFFIKMVW